MLSIVFENYIINFLKNAMIKNEFMDLKGLKCPLPVLKIAKKINQIEVGDKIKVKVDDPKAESDINELKKMNIKIVEKNIRPFCSLNWKNIKILWIY